MTKITNTASHKGHSFTRKSAKAYTHAVIVRSSHARLQAAADKMLNAGLKADAQAMADRFAGTEGRWGALTWASSKQLAEKAMKPFAHAFDEFIIVEVTH